MKHFQVPQDVDIKPWAEVLKTVSDVKPERKSFLNFATFIWLSDARAYTEENGKVNFVRQVRWAKVIEKFESAKPGDWISLEDTDWETLKKIVESPVQQFVLSDQRTPAVPTMMACIPFSQAVLGAVDELPASEVLALPS